MCEANAYMVKGDQEDMLLEAVDVVQELGPDEWQLVSIFGEQKTLKARMQRMALGQHKLYFTPLE